MALDHRFSRLGFSYFVVKFGSVRTNLRNYERGGSHVWESPILSPEHSAGGQRRERVNLAGKFRDAKQFSSSFGWVPAGRYVGARAFKVFFVIFNFSCLLRFSTGLFSKLSSLLVFLALGAGVPKGPNGTDVGWLRDPLSKEKLRLLIALRAAVNCRRFHFFPEPFLLLLRGFISFPYRFLDFWSLEFQGGGENFALGNNCNATSLVRRVPRTFENYCWVIFWGAASRRARPRAGTCRCFERGGSCGVWGMMRLQAKVSSKPCLASKGVARRIFSDKQGGISRHPVNGESRHNGWSFKHVGGFKSSGNFRIEDLTHTAIIFCVTTIWTVSYIPCLQTTTGGHEGRGIRMRLRLQET